MVEEGRRIREAGRICLLACLALHDKAAGDAPFLKALRLIEGGADDDRNFVKKGVSWALRLIGRRNQALNTAAVALCERLVTSSSLAAALERQAGPS
jgi:3-methyladenine DNA glycosylase AlkD